MARRLLLVVERSDETEEVAPAVRGVALLPLSLVDVAISREGNESVGEREGGIVEIVVVVVNCFGLFCVFT